MAGQTVRKVHDLLEPLLPGPAQAIKTPPNGSVGPMSKQSAARIGFTLLGCQLLLESWVVLPGIRIGIVLGSALCQHLEWHKGCASLSFAGEVLVSRLLIANGPPHCLVGICLHQHAAAVTYVLVIASHAARSYAGG